MVLVFLIAPIGVIVPLSFSAGSFLHFPLPGLSLRWVTTSSRPNSAARAEEQPDRRDGATLIATTLGTLAAFGFWRALAATPSVGFLLAPLVARHHRGGWRYFAFAKVGLVDGYLGLMLAHAALGTPFVLVTVLSTLSGFDRNLLNAAASLGAPVASVPQGGAADHLSRRFSGALFAFATSFDEVVVAQLLTGPGQRAAAPDVRRHQRQHQSHNHGRWHALVVFACVLLVVAEALRRRSEQLRTGRAV
jgi:putative spermidine/putrescine transport system permease protein